MAPVPVKPLLPLSCLLLCCLLNPVAAEDVSENGDQSFHVSAANSIVWGPGLKPDVVVPARYFFIQAVDEDGAK